MMIDMPFVSTLHYAVPGSSDPVVRQVVDTVECDVPVEVDEGVPVAYRWTTNPHSGCMAEARAKAGVRFAQLNGEQVFTVSGPVTRGMDVDGLRKRVRQAVTTLAGLWWILDISPTQGAIEYPMSLVGVDETTVGIQGEHPGADLVHDDRKADAFVARDEYETHMFVRDGEVWVAMGDAEPTWRVRRGPGRGIHLYVGASSPNDVALGFPAGERDLAEAAARWLGARHREEVACGGYGLEHLGFAASTPVEVNVALSLRACAVLRTGVDAHGWATELPPARWRPDPGWTDAARDAGAAMMAAFDVVMAKRDADSALAAIRASRAFLDALPRALPRGWVQARGFRQRSAWLVALWDGLLSPDARERKRAEPGRKVA